LPTRWRRAPLTGRDARRVTVAVTGGIGAGKSEALKAFARHGAATSSSDQIVHGLLHGDPDVLAAVRDRWGDAVVGDDGADRAAIAAIVFESPDELAWLESLLHPRVVREYTAWQAEQDAEIVVTEVPLLYETGGEVRFDRVVVVTAPPAVRRERSALPRDAREQRLLPDEEKVRRADFAYVNDGTLEELDAFVAGVVAQLGS
jgi:dephospho-CoA kinase